MTRLVTGIAQSQAVRNFIPKFWVRISKLMDIEICPCCGKPKKPIEGKYPHPGGIKPRLAMGDGWQPAPDIIAPATPLAQTWAGHRYGLQALKPALEPIIVFQRPYDGRLVDCITRTGAGALNIDGGRIRKEEDTGRPQGTMPHPMDWGNKSDPGEVYRTESHPAGRWPANLVLTHHPDCNGSCVDGCPVKAMGEQSGSQPSNGRKGESGNGKKAGLFGLGSERQETYFDSGTAARFFFQADWAAEVAEQLANADPVFYQAKAGRKERDAGLDGFGITQKPGARPDSKDLSGKFPDHDHREVGRNPHPTIKPLALARYLAGLLLPPAAYAPRRILIPFAGSGSEMIGAFQAGWEEVLGIEREASYVEIARARLAHWLDSDLSH